MNHHIDCSRLEDRCGVLAGRISALESAVDEERKSSLQVLEALSESVQAPAFPPSHEVATGASSALSAMHPPPALAMLPVPSPAQRVPPPQPAGRSEAVPSPAQRVPSPQPTGRSEAVEYAESLWQYAQWARQGAGGSASQDASQLVLLQPQQRQQQ